MEAHKNDGHTMPINEEMLTQLEQLYQNMDISWEKVALQYRFSCNGCEDNCCQSLFYHHTFVERDYLLKGYNRLDPALKEQIAGRARNYIEKTLNTPTEAQSLKIMCPLNQDGKCLTYAYRPMICRLHGLPHELARPGQIPVRGRGCSAGRFEDQPYVPFDRTEFYREMARIEAAYRGRLKLGGKLKLTIAQMLIPAEPDIQIQTFKQTLSD